MEVFRGEKVRVVGHFVNTVKWGGMLMDGIVYSRMWKWNLEQNHCKLHTGRSCCDVSHWFEALSLHFGRRHLVFLQPEVTIFGREGGAEQMLS